MAGESWPEPEQLARQTRRVREVLDADMTVFSSEGLAVVTNMATRAAPLPPENQKALLAQDEVILIRPRTAAASVQRDGQTLGYVLLSPRKPAPDLQAQLLTIAIIIALVTAASVLLARHIGRPLTHLIHLGRPKLRVGKPERPLGDESCR